MSDTPTCDKCGIEITTGIQFAYCPHADECELWPHGTDHDGQLYAWRTWAIRAREAFAAAQAERDALREALVEQRRQMEFPGLPEAFALTMKRMIDAAIDAARGRDEK